MAYTDKLKPLRTDFKPLSLPGLASVEAAERTMDVQKGLGVNLKYASRAVRRSFKDMRQTGEAAQHIGQLPAPDEALHMVASGKYSLWHTIPAILGLAAPQIISSLRIVTLSFSKDNADALGQLLDTGKIQRATLLCSHYFCATSADIYEKMRVVMQSRGQRFLSMRIHAKILLIAAGEHRITIESSCNLRSCKNIEQLSVFGDPGLYDFHAGWIDDLFTKNGAK